MPAATASPRHDFYSPPHKGLRQAMTALLVRIGATDFTDRAAVAALLPAIRLQIEISASHLKHEDREIHTALEERCPGSARQLDDDHDHHRAALAALETLTAEIEAAGAAERPALGRDLYLAFSQFVSEDLAHMAYEERVTLPLLQDLFTDEELIAMEARIVGAIPPEKKMVFLRLMMPAMNPAERYGFLQFARNSAPPEAFAAMVEHGAKPSLAESDWADLAGRLGLAA